MDLISRAWLKEAIHNFFNGLSHKVTEEDIQTYIEATPSAFEGMTNGEVMKAVFSNCQYHDFDKRVNYVGMWDGNSRVICDYPTDWWNAPYQKGGE